MVMPSPLHHQLPRSYRVHTNGTVLSSCAAARVLPATWVALAHAHTQPVHMSPGSVERGGGGNNEAMRPLSGISAIHPGPETKSFSDKKRPTSQDGEGRQIRRALAFNKQPARRRGCMVGRKGFPARSLACSPACQLASLPACNAIPSGSKAHASCSYSYLCPPLFSINRQMSLFRALAGRDKQRPANHPG